MSNDATWSQANHTLTLIGQQNPTSEHLKALHDGAITDLVQAIMNGSLPSRERVREFYGLGVLQPEIAEALATPITNPGTLTVNYAMSLGQMIVAGNYGEDSDNWNKDITAKRFPIVGTGIVEFEFKLFHPNRFISSESVVEIIKNDDKVNPWEPAKTEHTFAYGAQYPDEQRKYPIIGLGSVGKVYGFRSMLCLHRYGSKRHLNLSHWNGDWDSNYRFLAVRKKVSRPSAP